MYNVGDLKLREISEEIWSKVTNSKVLSMNLKGNFSNEWDGQKYDGRREKNLNFRKITEEEREKYHIPEGLYFKYLGFDRDVRNQSWIQRKIKNLEGMIADSKRLRIKMDYFGDTNIINHYVYKVMGIDCYLFFREGILHEEDLMKLLTWIPSSIDNRGVVEFGYNILLSWIVEDIVSAYMINLHLQKYGDDSNYNFEFITDAKGGTDLIFDRSGKRYYVEVVEDGKGTIRDNRDMAFREYKLPSLINKSKEDNVIIVVLNYDDNAVYALNLNKVKMKEVDKKNLELIDEEDDEKDDGVVHYYKTYKEYWKKNVYKIHKMKDSFTKVRDMDMDIDNYLAVI